MSTHPASDGRRHVKITHHKTLGGGVKKMVAAAVAEHHLRGEKNLRHARSSRIKHYNFYSCHVTHIAGRWRPGKAELWLWLLRVNAWAWRRRAIACARVIAARKRWGRRGIGAARA